MGGGTIVYGPPAESIPALSDAMLVVLGMLLAVVAFRVLRNYPGGRPLASIVALSIAGLSGISGTNVIQEAYAFIGYSMTDPNGGSIYINYFGGEVPVDNTTGRAQQIKSITSDTSCAVVAPASSPACAPGGVVPNGNTCWVQWACALPD